MDPALPIAAFLRDHYGPAHGWPDAILLAWVRWHLGEGDVATVRPEAGGDIVGVAIVRPVMRVEDAEDDYYARDPEGPVLWVDAIVTAHPSALPALWLAMERRFGRRPFIGGLRDGRVRRWPLARYRRLVLGAARRNLLLST